MTHPSRSPYSATPTPPYVWFIVTMLMLCGFYIRIGEIAGYFFSTDDLWHLVMAKQPTIMGVITANLAEDVHPPLSYLLLHFMLKVSDNVYFLKSISLLPGVLLIPMMYLLGKERFGVAAGIIMAFFIAFNEWTVMLSGVIRAYSMMLLCVTYALWAMLRFDKTRQNKYVLGYFIAMFLAIELVHSAAFFIFATGSLWFFKNVQNKDARPFLIGWTGGHILLAGCVLLYMVILNYHAPTTYFIGYNAENYADMAFDYFKRAAQFILENTSSRYDGLFLVGTIFFMVGLYNGAIYAKDVLYLFISTLSLLIVADYMDLFPLSPYLRNYIFLGIFVHFIIGFSAQLAADSYTKALSLYRDFSVQEIKTNKDINLMTGLLMMVMKVVPMRGMEKIAGLYVPVLLCLAVTATLTAQITQDKFYRFTTNVGMSESSTKSDAVKDIFTILSTNVEANDIIITASSSRWMFQYLLNVPAVIQHTPYVAEISPYKVPVFTDGQSNRDCKQLEHPHDIQRFFKDMKKLVDFSKVRSIWFVNIGWRGEFFHRLMTTQFTPPLANRYCTKTTEPCAMTRYHAAMEMYELSWKFLLSDQIKRTLFRAEGDEAQSIYSVTPQFIEDEIMSKQFTDVETLEYNQ